MQKIIKDLASGDPDFMTWATINDIVKNDQCFNKERCIDYRKSMAENVSMLKTHGLLDQFCMILQYNQNDAKDIICTLKAKDDQKQNGPEQPKLLSAANLQTIFQRSIQFPLLPESRSLISEDPDGSRDVDDRKVSDIASILKEISDEERLDGLDHRALHIIVLYANKGVSAIREQLRQNGYLSSLGNLENLEKIKESFNTLVDDHRLDVAKEELDGCTPN